MIISANRVCRKHGAQSVLLSSGLTCLFYGCVRYLLSSPLPAAHMKSVNDIMPMIGARFYTQLDAAQVKCDVLEGELAKVGCAAPKTVRGQVWQLFSVIKMRIVLLSVFVCQNCLLKITLPRSHTKCPAIDHTREDIREFSKG